MIEESPYPPGAIHDAVSCLERSMAPYRRMPWLGKVIARIGWAFRMASAWLLKSSGKVHVP